MLYAPWLMMKERLLQRNVNSLPHRNRTPLRLPQLVNDTDF